MGYPAILYFYLELKTGIGYMLVLKVFIQTIAIHAAKLEDREAFT